MQEREVSTPVVIALVVVVLALVGGAWWYFAGQGNAVQASTRAAPPPWIDPVTKRPRAPGYSTSPIAPQPGRMMPAAGR